MIDDDVDVDVDDAAANVVVVGTGSRCAGRSGVMMVAVAVTVVGVVVVKGKLGRCGGGWNVGGEVRWEGVAVERGGTLRGAVRRWWRWW